MSILDDFVPSNQYRNDIDEQAAREGSAIRRLNQYRLPRVKRQHLKTGPVKPNKPIDLLVALNIISGVPR